MLKNNMASCHQIREEEVCVGKGSTTRGKGVWHVACHTLHGAMITWSQRREEEKDQQHEGNHRQA